MASLIYYKTSKCYWIRINNPFAEDKRQRRKSFNTKITITSADQKRIAAAEKEKNPHLMIIVKLRGDKKTKELLEKINLGLRDQKLQKELKVKIRNKKTLSEGFDDFQNLKNRKGDPNALKKRTIESYKGAIDKFISACGDNNIEDYTNKKDFTKFLKFLADKKYSENSIAIYCRSLRAVWSYFVKENLAPENIIERITPEDPLPPSRYPLKIWRRYKDTWRRKTRINIILSVISY